MAEQLHDLVAGNVYRSPELCSLSLFSVSFFLVAFLVVVFVFVIVIIIIIVVVLVGVFEGEFDPAKVAQVLRSVYPMSDCKSTCSLTPNALYRESLFLHRRPPLRRCPGRLACIPCRHHRLPRFRFLARTTR